MNFLELVSIHGGAILFAGITTYTIVKCVMCDEFIEVFTDTDDDEEDAENEQK